FFFSSRIRHTRCYRDWSSDVCSSDLLDERLNSLGATIVTVKDAVDSYFKLVHQANPKNPVSVEIEQPDTHLQVTRRHIKLSLSDGDMKAQIAIIMLTEPAKAWTLSMVEEGLKQRGWPAFRGDISKNLKELAGLGLVNPIQAGTRTDYRLVQEKITVEN